MVASRLLATLVLSLLGVPVAQAETLPFPGGVAFESKIDEMTDKKVCAVFTPMRGFQAAVYGSSVAFWVPPTRGPVARFPAPMMRIGKAPPIPLTAADKPHMIAVPQAKARELIKALYLREKIVVRWYDFPKKDEHNITVETGDFGAAYDHAVKACGWQPLGFARNALPKEPTIYRGDKGYLSATFGGEWRVTFMAEYASCEIRSGSLIGAIFNSRAGRPESVLPLGRLRFFDSNAGEVATVEHGEFTLAPVSEIIAAAKKAGEYGFVDSEPYGKASLFGLREAIAYAEKTCKIAISDPQAQPPKAAKGEPIPMDTPGPRYTAQSEPRGRG